MQIKILTSRAALLLAAVEALSEPEAIALTSRTDEAEGPYGEAARALLQARDGLNRLYAEHGPSLGASLRLYRTADGRVFDRPEQADDHSVEQEDRGLDVLTALVTSVRPIGERPNGGAA